MRAYTQSGQYHTIVEIKSVIPTSIEYRTIVEIKSVIPTSIEYRTIVEISDSYQPCQ